MDRREYLKNTAIYFGVSLTGISITTIVSSCKADPTLTANTSKIIIGKQFDLLSEITETILPKSSTPGAKDIGVAAFIDSIVANCYDAEAQKTMIKNLVDFDDECTKSTGKSFVTLNEKDRHDYLMKLEYASRNPMTIWGINVEPELPNPSFYKQIKGMTLWGFYTSEKICKEHLAFKPIPGEFKPCVDVGKMRAWSE